MKRHPALNLRQPELHKLLEHPVSTVQLLVASMTSYNKTLSRFLFQMVSNALFIRIHRKPFNLKNHQTFNLQHHRPINLKHYQTFNLQHRRPFNLRHCRPFNLIYCQLLNLRHLLRYVGHYDCLLLRQQHVIAAPKNHLHIPLKHTSPIFVHVKMQTKRKRKKESSLVLTSSPCKKQLLFNSTPKTKRATGSDKKKSSQI